MTIETSRLQLRSYDPADLLALIEGVPPYEARMGFHAAAGLRDFIVSGEVSPKWLAQLRSATAADIWMLGFAVVHREHQSVIGTLGFKGPPDEAGMVEIAYGIVPSYQGQGYASEAAAAAVAFAFGTRQVHIVRAHTLPTNAPSIGVLLKCGFTRIGEIIDPEDGLVLRWERSRG